MSSAANPPGPQAGVTGTESTLSQIKHYDFPNNYARSVYTGPGHITSLRSAARPTSGRPGKSRTRLPWPALLWRPNLNFSGELINNPYQLDLSRQTPRPASLTGASLGLAGTPTDNPFTPAELEQVLRLYDVNANSMAKRLVKLAPSLVTVQSGTQMRNIVTTESYDVPVPSTNAGVGAGAAATMPSGKACLISDLLRQKIIQGRTAASGTGTPPSASIVNTDMTQLLAWELMVNRRMNINRPLGDGRDDNGNGTVDEPEEAVTESGNSNWTTIFGNTVPFQMANGMVDASGKPVSPVIARQLYAHHLYVLMMLLLDTGYVNPRTQTGYDQPQATPPQTSPTLALTRSQN